MSLKLYGFSGFAMHCKTASITHSQCSLVSSSNFLYFDLHPQRLTSVNQLRFHAYGVQLGLANEMHWQEREMNQKTIPSKSFWSKPQVSGCTFPPMVICLGRWISPLPAAPAGLHSVPLLLQAWIVRTSAVTSAGDFDFLNLPHIHFLIVRQPIEANHKKSCST